MMGDRQHTEASKDGWVAAHLGDEHFVFTGGVDSTESLIAFGEGDGSVFAQLSDDRFRLELVPRLHEEREGVAVEDRPLRDEERNLRSRAGPRFNLRDAQLLL